MMGAATAEAQVIVDRLLQRVGSQVITELDVRRARLLRLVAVKEDTDVEIQRELENHWLMVAEVARFSPARPDPGRLAAERQTWEAGLAPGTDVPALLARAGSTPAELEAWLENRIKIRDYVAARFGATPAADQPAAIASWIRALRDRAGLR
jgi:hypothetical protein